MEEWMHSVNPKQKVRAARRLIAQVLRTLKKVFPRNEGQGHNLPKFHGMTKMQYYMCLFGSGMNFYGGPGESAHKYFVKGPGDNTQRRIHDFAKQISNRVYECMIFEVAKEKLHSEDAEYELIGQNSNEEFGELSDVGGDDCELIGKYLLKITHINDDEETGKCEIEWKYQNKTKNHHASMTFILIY